MGIAQLLKSEMRSRHWNQAALARHLGVKQQLVSRWLDDENGVRPSLESCQVIADRLGYPLPSVFALAWNIPAGSTISKEGVQSAPEDPEWELMQRELREIYQSWDRSQWQDLLAVHKTVASAMRPAHLGSTEDTPQSSRFGGNYAVPVAAA